jgi:hypothetical protein
MKKRISPSRIVLACIGIASLSIGILLVFKAWSYRQQLDEWQVFEPIRMKVDLSQPGVYTGKFVQTFTGSHGQCLHLELDETFSSEKEMSELLRGFKCSVSITDEDANAVLDQDFSDTDFVFWGMYGGPKVPQLRLWRTALGEYDLKLLVIEGAPGLAGRRQVLVGRYLMCGMELMPVFVMGAGAFVFINIGIAVGVILKCTGKKKRTEGPVNENPE